MNEPDLDVWHDRLIETGFNTVSLTAYARQQRWDSAELGWDPPAIVGDPSADSSNDASIRAPFDPEADLVRKIQAAKKRGLRVVLILRVVLDHAVEANRFLWHGLIQPRTEHDLDQWFERYRQFALGWAEVAEREGVDVFGVGSELSSLTSTIELEQLPALEEWYLDDEKQQQERAKLLAFASSVEAEKLEAGWGESYSSLPSYLDDRRAAQAEWARQVTGGGVLEVVNGRRKSLEARWRSLIAEVGSVYSGLLTYAANFDQYDQVAFWDALDVMGVNGYFPLRTRGIDAPVDSLEPVFVESWRRILREIDAVRVARGAPELPLLFTELGYTRRRGCTIEPWASRGVAVVEADLASGAEPTSRAVVWEKEPLEPYERALAVRALRIAAQERKSPHWKGLLYWKLSTVADHSEIEPFLLVLDPARPVDPLLSELRSFRSTGP